MNDGTFSRVTAPPPAVVVPSRKSTVNTVAGALNGWFRAVTLDALLVGLMWLVGLEVLRVPWAPVWAVVGALCQFIPVIGGMLAVAGPAIAAVVGGGQDTLFHLSMVLGLYAGIMIVEGLVIGPMILHRHTLVPWWAALLGPVAGGILLPPWGVLIAPPVLAVGFALWRRRSERE